MNGCHAICIPLLLEDRACSQEGLSGRRKWGCNAPVRDSVHITAPEGLKTRAHISFSHGVSLSGKGQEILLFKR